MQIAGSISNLDWLYGEAGNDRLNAGAGGSLLFGGDENDELLGGSGRDIMIGGAGADRLVGNSNDDILVAGLTTKDSRAAAGHEDFWCNVLAEWNSTGSFTDRVNRLRTGSGSTNVNLIDAIMDDYSDDEFDFLTGSSGEDWLIFLAGEDRVVGHSEAIN